MASFSRRKFLGSSAASLAVPGDISVEIPEPETSSTSEGFAGSAVDFRYAPRFSQATICFPFRPCVRNAVVCSVFSLAGRLPSVSSASGRPAWFRHFFGSTRPSDSPSACMLDLSSWPSPTGPPHEPRRALMGSPGSRAWSVCAYLRSQTARGPSSARTIAPVGVAFRLAERRRHADLDYFATQYPACTYPGQRFDGSLATSHVCLGAGIAR
jgi:hypothetical protein